MNEAITAAVLHRTHAPSFVPPAPLTAVLGQYHYSSPMSPLNVMGLPTSCSIRAASGRCCFNIRLDSRAAFAGQQLNSVVLSRSQTHAPLKGIAAAASAARTMASDAPPSNAGRSGFHRPRGRGRPGFHREERSVKARYNRNEHRHWLTARNEPPKHHERFVIVSYNILADVNARTHYQDLYWHIPGYKWNYILDWEARKRKILWELGLWSPDIMCLQEVDHYDDLDEALQEKGYVGVFTGRTGRSKDGCAMFWRTNRFELLEEESIKFNDHNLRDNVAQLCVLKYKANANTPRGKNLEHNDSEDSEITEPSTSGSFDSRDRCVVVGNIHVLFNPKRGDVKLGQTRLLMEKAHAISERWGKAPVALAGDFNSTPNSPLYQFISSSQLDLAAHDRRNISGQEAEMDFSTDRHSNGACKDERQATTSGPSEASRADEESLPECIKTFELEESTVVTTGEANSVAEISLSTTSTETLKRVSIPPRIRGWDQCELMAATGGKRLSVVHHNMNLRSAYSEIEGKPGSRDERGEPWVTTCHKKFSGTVDYIWHTDDLVTVRVLDTIQTSDLPSEKWGSDHLALACEFSFVPSKDKAEHESE